MSKLNSFVYTASKIAGTRGATSGLEASSASPSSAVSERKEERYAMREGRSSREEADMCCIVVAMLYLSVSVERKF